MSNTSKYRVIKVGKGDLVRLRIRTRKRIPYVEIIELMIEGHEVFLPDVNRRTAWYIKKKLSEMIGSEVISYPAELHGMKGYLFKISLVSEILDRLREENIKKNNN